MKKASLALLAATLGIWAVTPSRAGVKVTVAPEPVEKSVAFRTADNKYVTTNSGGTLNLSGQKIGSKQIFTIIDLNGTDLTDGDSIRIRYTPHAQSADQAKSSYWREAPEGVKRDSEGEVFKLKVMGTKYAFQTPSGKFVAGVVINDTLGISDKQAEALVVDFVDLSSGIPKTPKQPPAKASAAQ